MGGRGRLKTGPLWLHHPGPGLHVDDGGVHGVEGVRDRPLQQIGLRQLVQDAPLGDEHHILAGQLLE